MKGPPRAELGFAEFTLDAANAQLRRGRDVITLRPKTLAVLCHLADRAGQLVDKAELMERVWPDAVVGDWVLAGCIQELRRILDDDPRQPRFIETVHRRGYRFIAPVEPARRDAAARILSAPVPGPAIVGRDAELAELDGWLAAALAGQRQFGFLVGEAGIGKTSLVDVFRNVAAARHPGVLFAHGQCIEWRQEATPAAEPYLPVIEALARLCSTAAGAQLRAGLRRLAPSWLALLPGLDDEPSVQRATTRERLALEMIAFLGALTQPLVLTLEDLHWADSATIELLTSIAQRRDPAPLLVLATYRPADAAMREHPVKTMHLALRARGRCRDLWLRAFDEAAVRAYLGLRCLGLPPADTQALARVIVARTDGNPLFVASVVDHLETDGSLVSRDGGLVLAADLDALAVGIPLGLRQMIGAQIDQLAVPEREVLEAGSLSGFRFSAEAAAAVGGGDVVEVEARLEHLARRGQLVRSIGEEPWPDGTVAGAYEFTHALFGDVLRDRVPAAMRRRGHLRIATRLAEAWGDRSSEIAADLAFHFEAGGAAERAIPHLHEAAARASRVGAYREAVAFLERGLAGLDALPRTPDRTLQTIRLCMALGQALQAPEGFTSAASEQAFLRARALSEDLDDPVQLVQTILALTSIYTAQGRFGAAIEMSAHIPPLLARVPLPALAFYGNVIGAMVRYHAGDLRDGRALLERALEHEAPPAPATLLDFRVHALNYLAVTLLQLGHPDLARAQARQAVMHAATTGLPFDRASAAMFSCLVCMHLRDVQSLASAAADAERLGTEYGFQMQGAVGLFARGYAQAAAGDHAGGVSVMEDGIERYRRSGQPLALPRLLAMLADVHVAHGKADAARSLVAEARALVGVTGELRITTDLDRLAGEIARIDGDLVAAERFFRGAMHAARAEHARWHELRATLSLARLFRAIDKGDMGAELLAPIAGAFSEGGDLPDVRDARELARARNR
jgi:DNA-binding winged helix-turn-helix (wHTH) protein/tetratricopeptide (TPR) repeat protein